ncbi:hypothetical protein [Paraburkholderia sp. 22B1P]|uniref:hypothetical protein n=1 Tax=Paraburkholderia sp. 22B1P TaxID=3080498 RepID=UPI0030916A25|nr:hypothetical protein PBP221_33810 [Paraburkholderia sp. 22B1P]
MSTDLNASFPEDLELPEIDSSTDVDCDDFDCDYDPPMPYDYRRQWAADPVGWAVLYAANLIRQFERGPDFYRNLDASVIEGWVFSDYPELLQTLRSGDTLAVFRSGVVRHCRAIQAAALLANEIISLRQGTLTRFRSDSAECEEFFPGWLTRIRTEPEWAWHTQLPGLVAELRGKWTAEEFFNSHHSDEVAPHSFLPRGESRNETPEDQRNITAHVLERGDFTLDLKFATKESLALVIKLPSGVNFETLTQWNHTTWAVHKRDDGSPVWDLVLGNGVLAISLLDHETILNRFRARLPVIYEREGEKLVVEYDWSPMAFGREYMQQAKSFASGPSAAAGLPPRLFAELSPEAIRIERTCPMSMAEFFGVTGFGSTDDDDAIPF